MRTCTGYCYFGDAHLDCDIGYGARRHSVHANDSGHVASGGGLSLCTLGGTLTVLHVGQRVGCRRRRSKYRFEGLQNT